MSERLTRARTILEQDQTSDQKAEVEAAWLTASKLLQSAECGMVRLYTDEMLVARWGVFYDRARDLGTSSTGLLPGQLPGVMSTPLLDQAGAPPRDYRPVAASIAAIQDVYARRVHERNTIVAIQRRRLISFGEFG